MTSPAPVNTSDPFGRRDGLPRKEVVAGSVTSEEKREILEALANGGFANASEGARRILLAYLRSAQVRDTVHGAIRDLQID